MGIKISVFCVFFFKLEMAEEKKKQPVFTKVEQLRPMATGLNLTVKVISSKTIAQRGGQGRQMRLAECLVGDETGVIIFTARNDQGLMFFSFFVSPFVSVLSICDSWI